MSKPHNEQVPLVVDDYNRAFLHPSITKTEEATELLTGEDLHFLCGVCGYTFKVFSMREFIPCQY